MNSDKLHSYLSLLKEIRKNLLGDVEKNFKVSQEETPEPLPDITDGAAQAYTNELLTSLGEQDWQKLKQVDEAIEKINKGEYGICSTCDQPIPEARLEVMPFAKFCVECMSKIEREPETQTQNFEEGDFEGNL
ncbi:MAG: molecular chaperone DnaK [Nitrospinaceae bacterium]|nr:MAG: molecular chaperone DnaK [Nitrospinaceae bacterium]